MVLLIVLNSFLMAIVVMALAGTKGKLDIVEMMLKAEQKRRHLKGLAQQKNGGFSIEELEIIERICNEYQQDYEELNEDVYSEEIAQAEKILDKLRKL